MDCFLLEEIQNLIKAGACSLAYDDDGICEAYCPDNCVEPEYSPCLPGTDDCMWILN